jgi:hypothetical protein
MSRLSSSKLSSSFIFSPILIYFFHHYSLSLGYHSTSKEISKSLNVKNQQTVVIRKILIVYATVSGTSKSMAQKLFEILSNKVNKYKSNIQILMKRN